MHRILRLSDHLRGMGRALLGYSGGVDSAVLAVVGRQALGPDGFLAVIGRSASYPEVQYRGAVQLAARHDIPLLEVDTLELDDPRYRANPTDRCYFCKTELWARLGQVARERGFETILDGTNASDLTEHRPGLRATTEAAVRSPLAELGWSKTVVREIARQLELPIWDAPASPCLSSRIQYGLEVTRDRLAQVERAESFLRALGVAGDLRVRHHGRLARIEAGPGDRALLNDRWTEVEERLLQLGFARVELDPAGYRRGGLLASLPVLSA